MWKDPVVDEVRAARQRILARFDGDVIKYCEHLLTEQAKHPERYAPKHDLRSQQLPKQIEVMVPSS